MTLDQLRAFLAVLEHGSFSGAARAIGVGQSTVSFHIAALEQAVGTPVLDRRGRSIRPTAAGRVLRRYAVRMSSLHEEALARLRAEERGEAGRLSIAASTIPAEYLLPPLLAVFRSAHPRVAVTVTVSDSRAAIAALLAEECDLALAGAKPRDTRLIATPFAQDDIVLVGPSPNPFAPKLRLTAAQLRSVPLVVREEGSGTRSALAAVLGRDSGPAEAGPAPIHVGSSEAAKQCARHGVGLAFVSSLAAAEDLAAGRLTRVAVPGLPLRRRFYVVRSKRVTMPTPARRLLALIVR
jgi:DNA-binding transcriptional LysR family regulator